MKDRFLNLGVLNMSIILHCLMLALAFPLISVKDFFLTSNGSSGRDTPLNLAAFLSTHSASVYFLFATNQRTDSGITL